VSLPCAYQVTLTVYDNSTPPLSATAQETINITEPPHPPVAVPGGPYIVSLCPACDCLVLDGSGSFSPDQGLSQSNCNTCPPDGITAYGWALTGAPYIYTNADTAIVDLCSDVTNYFPTPGTYEIGLQVTDNAAASFPAGTPTNLTGTGFTTVTVYTCGTQVTATPGCDSVDVSWIDVGATNYTVLSSTTGPNSGFTVATNVGAGVTNATIPATLGEVQWIRVLGGSGTNASLSCPTVATNTFANCICISELTIQTKATIAELQWPLVNGATSYNIYRSKNIPNFPLVPAFLIAKNVTKGLYVDGDLVNGATYYYRVSAVAGEVEQCVSIQVSGVPAAVKRH